MEKEHLRICSPLCQDLTARFRIWFSVLHENESPLCPLSPCCITPFLHTVFQSTKTLGSIRAQQKGYDKVSHAHCPVPLSLPLSPLLSDIGAPPSARRREREREEDQEQNKYLLSSTKWGERTAAHQIITALPFFPLFPLFFSSHAVGSLHFHLFLIHPAPLPCLSSPSLQCRANVLCWSVAFCSTGLSCIGGRLL